MFWLKAEKLISSKELTSSGACAAIEIILAKFEGILVLKLNSLTTDSLLWILNSYTSFALIPLNWAGFTPLGPIPVGIWTSKVWTS